MIRGTVNDDFEPCLQLVFVSSDGSRQQVQAVLDTGFSGIVTLPRRVIRRLRSPFVGSMAAVLADDSEIEMDFYLGFILWDGRERKLNLLAADGTSLVGMLLLKDQAVQIDVVPGGKITIQRRRTR